MNACFPKTRDMQYHNLLGLFDDIDGGGTSGLAIGRKMSGKEGAD